MIILDADQGIVECRPRKISGVYAIVHQPSGRAYIGSSYDVFRRWKVHVGSLNRGRHPSQKLLNAWLSDGADAFTFVVLERCPRERLQEREQEWLDSFAELLNASESAVSPLLTERGRAAHRAAMARPEYRQGQSAAKRGRVVSEATREKLRAYRATPEARQLAIRIGMLRRGKKYPKISAAKKGIIPPPASPETCARISAALRAYTRSPEHKARGSLAVAESNRRRCGKPWRAKDPEAWKRRISMTKRNTYRWRPLSPEHRAKISERIKTYHRGLSQ